MTKKNQRTRVKVTSKGPFFSCEFVGSDTQVKELLRRVKSLEKRECMRVFERTHGVPYSSKNDTHAAWMRAVSAPFELNIEITHE